MFVDLLINICVHSLNIHISFVFICCFFCMQCFNKCVLYCQIVSSFSVFAKERLSNHCKTFSAFGSEVFNLSVVAFSRQPKVILRVKQQARQSKRKDVPASGVRYQPKGAIKRHCGAETIVTHTRRGPLKVDV